MTQWKLVLGGVALCVVAGQALADEAYLRLRCDGDAAGAVITINGERKGECPIDLVLPEGDVKISARKDLDIYTFRTFEKELFLSSGAMKRESVVLGPVQFTAEGQVRENERIAREKAAAEALAEQQRLEAEEAAKYGVTADYIDDLSSKNEIDPSVWTTFFVISPLELPLFTLSDLASGKTKFIRAAADPAVFGNPDSMVARAMQVQADEAR